MFTGRDHGPCSRTVNTVSVCRLLEISKWCWQISFCSAALPPVLELTKPSWWPSSDLEVKGRPKFKKNFSLYSLVSWAETPQQIELVVEKELSTVATTLRFHRSWFQSRPTDQARRIYDEVYSPLRQYNTVQYNGKQRKEAKKRKKRKKEKKEKKENIYHTCGDIIHLFCT